MKKMFWGLCLLLASCTSAPKDLPYSENEPLKGNPELVWVGRGEASVFKEGRWIRTPENDYDFSVIQRRQKTQWISTKDMHRRNPGYDGSAGPRNQSLYFRVDFKPQSQGLSIDLESTLGNGHGQTDIYFRKTTLEFQAEGLSSMAPFNTYKISQNYLYEEGRLEETVELFKKDKGTIIPFARIIEKADLFAPTRFKSPPSTW